MLSIAVSITPSIQSKVMMNAVGEIVFCEETIMICNYLNEKYQENCSCKSSIPKVKYTGNANLL